MLILKEINKILNSYNPTPMGLKAGDRISPNEILILSDFFKDLNLKNEDIVLVSIIENKPNYVLTDKFIYFKSETSKQPVDSFDIEVLKQSKYDYLQEVYKSVLIQSINYLTKKETATFKTLDSFINKYKNFLKEEDQNFENKSLFFDGKYLEMLQHEAEEALQLCNELNADAHFVQSINLIFSNTSEAVDGYKAEHLLIADIIKAYNLIAKFENEKAKITLAYYFDKLQGRDLAKGISIQRLNEMTTKQSFNDNIEKIKAAQYIRPIKEYENEFLIPSILFRIQHAKFMKSGNIIYRFASIIAKADNTVNEEEKEILKQILQKTAQPKVKDSNFVNNSKEVPSDDNLDKVLAELNGLIGLDEIKKSITELTNLLKIQKIRKEKGLDNIENSLHAVFMGPPGTGKTTVARLLGRIYKHLSYLEKGHLVETDRFGMVAGYVGQTAIKVNEIVNQSIGGVLFIDEAYSLNPQDGGRDFGAEAIDALVKRMEDHRNDLVVIVAGYTEPMKLFVESNPGLRSRFNRFFKFEHFLPLQLLQIFETFCQKSDFILTTEAKDKLTDIFDMLYEKRDEAFGNARVVRNIFERCVQNQANRIVNLTELTENILQTIEETDIPEPQYIVEQTYFTAAKETEK